MTGFSSTIPNVTKPLLNFTHTWRRLMEGETVTFNVENTSGYAVRSCCFRLQSRARRSTLADRPTWRRSAAAEQVDLYLTGRAPRSRWRKKSPSA